MATLELPESLRAILNARKGDAAPKRMLSVVQNGNFTTVNINFSSLALIQECKRKAFYSLEMGLKPKEANPALLFGTGIHKALEVFYCANRKERQTSRPVCDDFQLHVISNPNAEIPENLHHGMCVRCSAVWAFAQVTYEALSALPDNDKRSLHNGMTIINSYCDSYQDDPYVVARDSLGPIIERDVQFELFSSDSVKINYFGTIDVILKNEITGKLIVCDHKTTSSLGSEFLNRIHPNFQYTGYVMAAQRGMELNVSDFLVNGILVAKTKRDFARQITHRTAEDFKEFTDSVCMAVTDYMTANNLRTWPMTSPNPCSNYGGCTFKSLCELPANLRENMIEARFDKGSYL